MGKRRFKPNRYKKKAGIPRAVSDFMARKGSIGGAIAAHRRYGTPLPPGIVDPKEASHSS